MYSSVNLVRQISGFQNSANISDSVVRNKILMGDSIINGVIGDQYDLPLRYHVQNTLTFSGTASGSGTMGVVINGVTYNVSIGLSDAASVVADAFRKAAIDSDDFIVDRVGSGAVVRILSMSDSTALSTARAEVNISSAPTTQSIAVTIGTREEAYPPAIEDLSAKIATAQLLMDEYGVEAQDSAKDGVQLYERCEKILAYYQDNEDIPLSARIRDEVTGDELPTVNEQAVSGLPNSTTEDQDTSDGPTAPQMSINKVF